MVLKSKGKRLLRKSSYQKVRDQLMKDITESINLEGVHGDKIIYHIENALDKEEYGEIKEELINKLMEEMDVEDEEQAEEALMVMLQEDICSELRKTIHTHSKKRKDVISDKIYSRGKKKKIWEHVRAVVLGKETSAFGDLIILLKDHSIIRWTLVVGFILLSVSSYLLGSIYKSVIAGLTLTAEPGDSLRIMLGNVTGALGGILLFFVFISLLIQDKYLARTRDERLRRLADKTLKEKFEK